MVGIDTSLSTLRLAREIFEVSGDLQLCAMDASRLGVSDETFDGVIVCKDGFSATTLVPSDFRCRNKPCR